MGYDTKRHTVRIKVDAFMFMARPLLLFQQCAFFSKVCRPRLMWFSFYAVVQTMQSKVGALGFAQFRMS